MQGKGNKEARKAAKPESVDIMKETMKAQRKEARAARKAARTKGLKGTLGFSKGGTAKKGK